MPIGLEHYLTVAGVLFTLGILGIFLNRKNVIVILMCVELMLLAVNINLVAFSAFLGDLVGQVYALFVLTVAAAEASADRQELTLTLPVETYPIGMVYEVTLDDVHADGGDRLRSLLPDQPSHLGQDLLAGRAGVEHEARDSD